MRKDIHNSDIPSLCQSCEARHKGICGALTADQLSALAKHSIRKEFTGGAELQSGDIPAANYANIMAGVVKLSKLLEDGRQQIVGLQFAPDFMGRPLRDVSETTAEAATDVKLCMFPRPVLDRMMADSQGLEHRLFQQTLKELDEARDWMVTLGRKTAREKVASFLYLIAKNFDPELENTHRHEITFDLPLARADIADFLGLTIETVSRQITGLRRDGVIQIKESRNITVPDLDRLRDVCGY